MPSFLVCAGCGWAPADDDPYPFRCPNAGTDGTDHVVVRKLDPSGLAWPTDDSANPFVRCRTLFHSYHLARANGMSDQEYVELVQRLDAEVAAVDGRGFEITPFELIDDLSSRLGFDVWVKDETGNVSGSHKARHLFGLLIHLEVVERLGLPGDAPSRRLAIASCGNAALAAGVVARAGGRALDVFVPPWADEKVVARLEELGATLTVCERQPGVAGDPTYHALQRSIAAGELPFTCQGNENGLAIEGGETIGYEIASRLGGRSLDRLFVQVGGGALASACIQGLGEAHRLGALPKMPRIHTVQTLGGYPLARAYDLVAERILARLAGEGLAGATPPEDEESRADLILAHAGAPAVQEELAYAVRHRSEFMWPWEEEPKSVAHGILDDETYDWAAVVGGMVATGGYPVAVDEATLEEANELGRMTTRIDADHTGTSGLAGLLSVQRAGSIGGDERVAVLFTGARR
jgi:threonine synthase